MGNVSILIGTIPPPEGTTIGLLSRDSAGALIVTEDKNRAFFYFGQTKNKFGSPGYDPRFNEQWFTEIFAAPAADVAGAKLLSAIQDKQSGTDLDLGLSSDYDCTVSSNQVRLMQPGSGPGRHLRSLVVDSDITKAGKRMAYEVWLYADTVNLADFSMIDGRTTIRRRQTISAKDLLDQIKPSTVTDSK